MKKVIILSMSALFLFAISCRKEAVVPLSSQSDKKVDPKALASMTLLGQLDLENQLNILNLGNYTLTSSAFNAVSNTTEVMRTYNDPFGNEIHVALADFGFLTQVDKDNYLSGVAFAISPVGSSTAFFRNADPSAGYQIGQYTGKSATSMKVVAGSGPGLFSDAISASSSSYLKPAVLFTNVPGWEIFDANTRVGFVILLVNNRFAIMVDGITQSNINDIQLIASSFNVPALTAYGQ